MRTIKQELEKIIKNTPFLEEGILLGIVNLSALARIVRPKLVKKMYKRNISVASLVMALKRMNIPGKAKKNQTALLKQVKNITVRDNLREITIKNSDHSGKIQKEILNSHEKQDDSFLNIMTGIGETTFIFNEKIARITSQLLKSEKIVSKIDNLSAITIDLPETTITTAGVYYLILKALAWENINIVEVVSNYKELTLIFDSKDVERAFSIIRELTELDSYLTSFLHF